MNGQELLVAISRTKRQIRLLHNDKIVAFLTPEQAFATANSGDFQGHGNKRNVKAISRREYRRPDAPWQKCWRTTEAAVFPPPYGFFDGVA